ncbi:MAG TPA: DUF2232 domain-containing protein [Gemmatimonadota bacterium]
MGRDPSPPARRRAPWREIGVAASLLLAGWPVALVAIALPFALYLPVLAPRPAVRVLSAVLLLPPLLFALRVPAGRPFVLAAALSAVAGVAVLARRPRLGYAEATLCALVGLVGAAAVQVAADPAWFAALESGLRQLGLSQGRAWVEWLERAGRLDPAVRLALEETAAVSAEVWARGWPAFTFTGLWLGGAAALAFAARAALRLDPAGGLLSRVRAFDPCSRFRLPDAWIGIFLAGVAGFLFLPHAAAGPWSRARDAALNAALVAAALYAWQGVAVLLYYLEQRGLRTPGRVVLLAAGFVLLPLPLLVLALGLGLADAWLDLRARRPRDTPDRPGV